jgi:hypothetical protein
MSHQAGDRLHILLYVPNSRISLRLAETLAEDGFTVTSACDRTEFAWAMPLHRYSAIVTGTPLVGEVRMSVPVPIINYEVFVHKRPRVSSSGFSESTYFDVDDFIARIRFCVRADRPLAS